MLNDVTKYNLATKLLMITMNSIVAGLNKDSEKIVDCCNIQQDFIIKYSKNWNEITNI